MDPDLDRFDSRRSTVYGPRGVVATSQPLAAEAGLALLREGGNAFDAAVATAAALNVVEPTSTGLGGDAFAMFRTADGDVGAMRACGGAPAGATRERVREAVADARADDASSADVSMPETGPHTVTVPGTARGWEATVERFGRRPLADALAPAIRYATQGYPVTPVVASQWTHAEDLFSDANAREAYLVDGAAPTIGQTVRLPALGRSLARVAERGADVVYEGAIAEAIASTVQAAGGFLTVDDLADFAVEWPEPVSTTYAGAEIYELPAPNQGPLALEALNLASALGAGDYPVGSADRTHYVIEAMKRAFVDGHRYLTDPDFADVPPLESPDYAQERAATVEETTAADVPVGPPAAGSAEDADTVLCCVADAAGNVVSFINSRYAGFGSGLVAGDTGIALQNRGASFSLDPAHPNRLEPGKRPFHTLIPGLAHVGSDDWAAFGVMGGFMQPQGHLQVLANWLDAGWSLQRALDAPRWRYRADGTLAVEARMDSDLTTGLVKRGQDVRVRPAADFGGAQVARFADGTLSGATEPRKDGHVATY